jgi:hypothetical protein
MLARIFVTALVALVAVAAAGCGGGAKHADSAKAPTVIPSTADCPINATQRKAIAHIKSDIRRLHRLEASMHKFRNVGTTAQENLTNTVLLEIGGDKLPINSRSRLLDLAKAAVGLCGDCFQAFEAEEPEVQTKMGKDPCSS